MPNKRSTLNADTVVCGYFENIEILFAVSDCEKTKTGVKVKNIRRVDEKKPNHFVPLVISLNDDRLELTGVLKKDIREYFNTGESAIKQILKKKYIPNKNIRRSGRVFCH